MIKIISYINCKNETIDVYYNEEREGVLIINCDTDQLIILREIKNMNLDMLEIIIKDFKEITFLSETFRIEYDDICWLKNYENSDVFFREILENTSDRALTEMLMLEIGKK